MGKKKLSAMSVRRRIDELKAEEKEIGEQVLSLGERLKLIEKDRKRFESHLKDLTKEHPIQITDHAVLQYLNRIDGIDVMGARRKVLPKDDRVWEAIKKLGGSGTFPVGTLHRLVLVKGSVVTVLEP